MQNNEFLEETMNQIIDDSMYKTEILESNVETNGDKKIGTVLISQELTDSNGRSFLTYHLMKTIFYYSGELYEFHLFSLPEDYEKSKDEFDQSFKTFFIGSVEKSPSPDIICGQGTIEKNGQCIVNTETKSTSKGGGCLIATATYGSELTSQVQQLRELRDSKLLQTEAGSSFIESFNSFYYSFSPYIADYERENPVFKEAVKLFITPMIASLSILNHVDMDSEVEVLGYGISLIILNLGMYVGIPVAVIIGMKKSSQNIE